MRLSHSKLSLILSNPMEYYLSYRLGITPKVEKVALSVGSAVHWGIEHNTERLDEYFGDKYDYSRDQLLAEAMIHGYFKHKDQIFDELLTDETTGEKLELLEETHELFIDGKLKSFKSSTPHIFVGIIDLLLLTNKGFIVVDYKTSSNIPNWDDYLDQLYRYIFLLKSEFPDIPVVKIAIINLRKTKIRQLKTENSTSFLRRMQLEYEINDESYVNWHIFNPKDLNKDFINSYIQNLSRMADTAEVIDLENLWFINYGATNAYGGSVYKNIIYHVPDCYILYNIADTIYDKYTKEVKKIRDCKPIDMLVVDRNDVLNKYEQFEAQCLAYFSVTNNTSKETLFEHLKKNFVCDDELLEEYWNTFNYKLENNESL